MTNSLQSFAIGYQGPISGTFRIMTPYLGESHSSRLFVRLRLEDASGYLQAFSWREEVMNSMALYDLSRAYIEGILRPHENQVVVELQTLVAAQVHYGDIVRLIPQSLCPRPELLPELATVMRLISLPPLRRFLGKVLSDDGIAFPFVNCPGSLNHHHNFRGGLLKHSLEGVGVIESQTFFPREDYELGLVAALFHDIGKILTYTSQMTMTSLGASIEHDKLTCEILAPALHDLHKDWPAGARKLRYLLGWKTKSAIPHYNMADLVACADRISTGQDMDRRKTKR